MCANPLLDSSALGGFAADVPDRVIGDWLLDPAMPFRAGKQIILGPLPSPVLTQSFEQFRCHWYITISGTFAQANMDNHPFAVHVAHLEKGCLGPANARSIENHEDGAMHEVWSSLDHAADFFRTKHHRQFSGSLWKDQIIVGDVPPLQGLLVEKSQRRHASFDRAGGKLFIAEQVRFKLTDLVTAQAFRRFSEIIRELFDCEDVAASRGWRVVTALEFVQHALAK